MISISKLLKKNSTDFSHFLVLFLLIMKIISKLLLTLLAFLIPLTGCEAQHPELINEQGTQLAERISAPPGYTRVEAKEGSFADWLRHIKLKPHGSKVKTYRGREKFYQNKHVAVINMDTGSRGLQQCADCILRLRAEYLWEQKRFSDLSFKFTSGDESRWTRWREGWRPVISGNHVSWAKTGRAKADYAAFRDWLENVFRYAGTISISRDFPRVKKLKDIKAGDFFVEAGSPGHAVMVMDIAVNETTGKKIMLLAQGFMPAQDMHILLNPVDYKLSPWFECEFGTVLNTPDWDFKPEHLRRLPE